MDRNAISDMEAVAAMPGLERLVDELLVDYKTRRTPEEVMSCLVFLAGRHAVGSANEVDSMLLATPLWDMLRASADRVGRTLPQAPLTFDKLRHFRDKLPAGAYTRLAAAFTEVAVPLAQSAGLLDPLALSPWNRPLPGNVIYGDGTVTLPWSGVMVDADGEVLGSRAKFSPHIPQVFEGKDGKHASAGLPFSLVGCHGRKRWQRAVLGVEIFFDRNEIGASMNVFRQVHERSGGGATHVVYDRLLSGMHLTEFMTWGMIPIVAMKQARKDSPHIVLPEALQKRNYASTKYAPKSRLTFNRLHTVEHSCPHGTCVHELWSLDGAVVTVDPNTDVSLDATVVECRNIEWGGGAAGGLTLTGVYVVPCRHGSVTTRIELSGTRPGRATAGRAPSMADWVRPIPEIAHEFSPLMGLRSDAESAFAHYKSQLPKGRATSLAPDDFLLDIIGAGLRNNAVLWDVHVALHTDCARNVRRLRAKTAQRR